MTSLCAAVALTLHIASWHSAPGYENANFGAGFDCEVAAGVTVSAGGYRNSYGRMSPYLTLGVEKGREVRVGLMAGIAGNYPKGTIAIGGFTAAVDVGRATLRLLYLPPAVKHDAMLHLMASFPLPNEVNP